MPLSSAELREFLTKPILAHIAVARRSGRPHVTPIWFLYEDDDFYFTTRLRRVKGKCLKKRPYASLSIATDERPYKAVIVEGKVELVSSNRDELMKRIAVRYGREEGERWFAYSLREQDRVVMKLRPTRVLSWHYGKGDYRRQNEGASMVTKLS